jgi:class 3 adenylate cyclase/tetratricopeptide (TPR) repeat protein
VTCSSCGAETPAGARFCPSCGADQLVRGDQRRVVTVVFADLVGFTALSEHRDPEQVKALVDRCFERLVADITAFGGEVDKIVGDAILALFGAPVAHEDDAERAVRAALQMHATLAAAESELGIGVRLRVGVNTGEVLVGALRAGGDYTAMGDVVNTAQRLQSAAEPGQVVVGLTTHRATRRVVTYRSIGEITAKGREAPVPAWVAEGARLPPGYRPDRHRTPLVGRDDELALLSSTLDLAVARQRAALVLVLGDAGVGKSRLVEEVAEAARGCHDAVVLHGRCVPYGEANVWWPVAEAVRAACDVEVGDSETDAAAKVCAAVSAAVGPDGALSPGPGAPPAAPGPSGQVGVERISDGLLHLLGFDVLGSVDAARARDEATQAVVAFTGALAARRPLALVLSDLHWADDAVLRLVSAVLERNSRAPFLLLASGRPALSERWTPPHGGHQTAVLHLDPLERDAAAKLLGGLADGRAAALDERVTADLLDRAGGNPFFLEELVSWLEETRAAELPDTLRGLVAARIDGLTPTERRVLEDAAVLGSRGRVEWVAEMHRQAYGGDGPLPGALAALHAADLLDVDGDRWEFRSEVVREVAYGTMTKDRRAKVHMGIARWLEQDDSGGDAVVERIAHHYGRAAVLSAEVGGASAVPADVAARAVSWLRRAGERAAQVDTPGHAVSLFTEALAVADLGAAGEAGRTGPDGDAPDDQRTALLLARSQAYAEMRDLAAARGDATAARERAERVGNEAAIVRATVVLADAAARGGARHEAEALLDEALARAGVIGDDEGRAMALRVRGFAALMRDDAEAAVASLEPALELYTGVGDRRGRAWVLQNLSWAHFISGRIEDAEALLHDSAALFAELGDRGGLGWALGLLAFTRFHLGYPAEAEAMAEQVFQGAEEMGNRWAVGMGLVLTASTRLWTGRAESAVERAREALATFEAIDDDYGRVQARVPLGRALVTSGHVAEGFEILEQIAASVLASDSPGFVSFSASGLLSAAVQVGDRERAAAALAVLPGENRSSDEMVSAGAGEILVARALAEVQSGRPQVALDLVSGVRRAIGDRADAGYTGAVLSLALAAAGRETEAAEAAAVVEADERSSYLDRLWAGLAAGASAARRGDKDDVEARFHDLTERARQTDDRIAQAVVSLGWALASEAVGDPAAATRRDESAARFAALGLAPGGWAIALGEAAGLAPAGAEADRS